MTFHIKEFTMRSSLLIGGILASVIVLPVLAQSAPPARTDNSTTARAAQPAAGLWRASKLKGLNVYNEQNEKIGDISEILIDKAGKVEGVVIGVGGFLGMGAHDVKVEMSALKFVDEAPKTATTSTNTTGSNTQSKTTSSDHKWYPDHAVMNGATKEKLKAMPEFKF